MTIMIVFDVANYLERLCVLLLNLYISVKNVDRRVFRANLSQLEWHHMSPKQIDKL